MTKLAKLLILTPVALALSVPAAAADTVGINSAIRNKVMTKPAGSSPLKPAVLKARVLLGDQVVTARKSMLQIRLLDRSNFTVGSNARVTIDRFVYDPSRNAADVGASVTKGAFRFMSGRGTAKGRTKVKTPVASIGIRGTIFEGAVGEDAAGIALGEADLQGLEIDPETATLIVLRGPKAAPGIPGGAIEVSANGKTILLDQPGMAIFIPGPGQDATPMFMLSDRGLMALGELLRTEPDQRGDGVRYDAEGNPIVDRTLEDIPVIRDIQTPDIPTDQF